MAQREAKRQEKERQQAEKRAGGARRGRRQLPANNDPLTNLDPPVNSEQPGNFDPVIASMAINGICSTESGDSQRAFTTLLSVDQGL